MYRLDQKLSRIRSGHYKRSDFIIADAKDGDMGPSIPGCGPKRNKDGSSTRFVTRPEFLDNISAIVKQDIVDIMLVSASNLEALTERGVFKNSAVKPAIRANDTTDIWVVRGADYSKQPSRPYRSASISRVMTGSLEASPGTAVVGTDLGLYSITFNNDLAQDYTSLEHFSAFRDDAARHNFKYFLEVFNPNVDCRIDPALVPHYINDCIVRCLAGVTKADRPQFLKIAYNGPKALEELASFDPSITVGVLGGGAGTTRDCFELLNQAEKYGARVALFGRKINLAEDPLAMVSFMREVASGNIQPLEAVKAYHGSLQKSGLAAARALAADSEITEKGLEGRLIMVKTQRRGFITGGTWCVDNNRMVTHWPEEDGIAQFIEEERHGGGSGCNFALDIKHLDSEMPVETITIVGNDEGGRFLLSLAEGAGIGHAQMHVSSNASTQWTDAFISKASGRRTHIFNPGVSDVLTPDHFDFSSTTARYLHLGLPGVHKHLDRQWQDDVNGWVTVLKRARAKGLKTNLELASIDRERLAKLVRPCLPHLDLIIVNDSEIGALSGMETIPGGVTDVAACERAARHVLENGAMEIVVVHCPVVAIAVTREGAVFTKPSTQIPRSLVAGANGAGDAFAAGMLYGLHERWSIDDALTLAHASAAASLRSLSTTGAVEPWRKCLELANQWGWRSA